MQTLKIQIPKGYEIESFDKVNGEIKFREQPKNIMDRIKTVDDVLMDNDLTEEELDEMFDGIPEHLKYQYIVELLCRSLNQGWTPDWSNSSEYKYFPWFEMAGSSGFRFGGLDGWTSGSYVGSRLCLKTSELAVYAGKQFIEVYKRFMI